MNSNFGIFTTDAQLVVRTWDLWLEQVTSRSASQVCGKLLTQVFPEIEARGLDAAFTRALEQGVVELISPALHGYLISCRPQEPIGKFRQMQQRTVIAPLRDGPKITGLVVTIEDVTERREAESEDIGTLAGEDWRARRQALDRILAEPSQTPVSELIHRLREHHRDASILNSVLHLLSSGAWETLEPLIELLRDVDAEVRMYAALALGELKDRRAVPALMYALSDDDMNVRYHTIEALAKLRASEAADALADIAQSGEFFLAFPALDALAAIGEPRVAARIVGLLNNEALRAAAIGALSQLGDHAVVPALVSMMDDPRMVPTVAEALTILHHRYAHEFGEGEYITELVARHISPAGAQNLVSAMESTTGEHLRLVVRVCGWIGTESESLISRLTRLLGSPSLRSEVIETLVRHGQRVTAPLCGQLSSQDLETRRAAVAALGRIGDWESVPALVRSLNDPELTVDAAGALARIGDARAYEGLFALIAHERGAVRQAVVGALNSLGQPRMAQDVRRLLTDPNPRARESAVRIAGYFGYPDCAPLLLDRVHDENEDVRRAAVETLPNLQDERAFTLLDRAIHDESPKIRSVAAQSLGQLEDSQGVPALLEAMTDHDAWVRYYAARSLGQIRSPESIDTLARVLREDTAPQVRIAAADALGAIGGRRAVSILAPFINSDDRDLARAALLALGLVGHPDALQPLLHALRSSESSQRLDAVRAISARRDSEAADALQWTAAADRDQTIAEAAIEELSRMATPHSIAALLRLASDRRLRESVIVQISRLGPTHLGRVKEGLSSPQLETRRAVVEALGRMRHPGASEALSIALDDERPEVRLAALLALRRLGSLIPERKLWNIAYTDPDPGVRQAAEQGLQR
jgi:HEAT repeat protein